MQINSNTRAALFDIDGTLTTGGNIWTSLLASPDVALWRKVWLYATAMPHHLLTKARLADQAAFRDRWVQLMAWLIAGWPESKYETLCKHILDEQLVPTLRNDVVDLLQQHITLGHPVILVSTMFAGIVQAMADYLDATAGLGSRVDIENERCTGRIVGLTCSGARKVDFAREYLAAHYPDISLEYCAAYADSHSDIPFLDGVGYPVAVYPDDVMRQEAVSRQWRVFNG